MRLFLSGEGVAQDKLASVMPVWDPTPLQHVSVALKAFSSPISDSLRDYIQVLDILFILYTTFACVHSTLYAGCFLERHTYLFLYKSV